MILAALLLAVAAPPPASLQLDDSESAYCLATGFCRRPAQADRPAPGVLFVATGLVGAGLAGLRARPRS